MPRLLLIDDDERLGPPLAAYMQRHGFALEHATRPSRGLERLEQGGIDAVILDVMLPEIDGFEVCRTIRKSPGAAAAVPIVMLTARGEVMDRIVGLELGADDYLPKPFEPRELLARIQTVLRRSTPAPTPNAAVGHAGASPPRGTLRFEGLAIDLDRHEVRRRGGAGDASGAGGDGAEVLVDLTGTEYELLVLLASHPGRVFSRDDILTRLRGHAAEDIASRAVDILVSRLRRKLEPLDNIRTLRNAGYRFVGVRV
jgi:OmpR family response regulator RpaB